MPRLDKPFRVGDRVVVNAHGQEIYGHNGKFLAGRKGTVIRIPTERWHSNEIVVRWDSGESSMFGCWAVDWEERQG